jgi:peptidoglycan-associated lipoprotein
VEEARNTLTMRVHFDYDMSEIRPDAERILRQKAGILRASPGVQLRIEGHADERGSNEYNLALGNRRAQAVADFFTNFGLDGSRFSIVSYGEERPIARASNESAWAQNRRAEFIITAGQDAINPGQTP